MTKKDIKVDFKKKIVYCKSKDYNEHKLYSYLMDLFDEPENMRYDIPMVAHANGKFEMVNGWRVKIVNRE